MTKKFVLQVRAQNHAKMFMLHAEKVGADLPYIQTYKTWFQENLSQKTVSSQKKRHFQQNCLESVQKSTVISTNSWIIIPASRSKQVVLMQGDARSPKNCAKILSVQIPSGAWWFYQLKPSQKLYIKINNAKNEGVYLRVGAGELLHKTRDESPTQLQQGYPLCWSAQLQAQSPKTTDLSTLHPKQFTSALSFAIFTFSWARTFAPKCTTSFTKHSLAKLKWLCCFCLSDDDCKQRGKDRQFTFFDISREAMTIGAEKRNGRGKSNPLASDFCWF